MIDEASLGQTPLTVGTHRRVLAQSLVDYMKADDQRRRDAAAELTQLGQEMGLI